MTALPYHDVLDQALAALRDGVELDVVLARFPEHAEELRRDLELSGAVAGLPRIVPPPGAQARAAAAARLQEQLAANREAAARPSPLSWLWSGLPRFALAAVVAVIAVVGFALVSPDGNGSVESATLEGVVLENEGGLLTIQTLDALEQVRVPSDAHVSDLAGGGIAIDSLAVGQVVVIEVERSDEDVVARKVQRIAGDIDAWCLEGAQRCATLAERLAQAASDCETQPGGCRALLERAGELELRARTLARLDELRSRCRQGDEAACREIVSFCSQHDVCGDFEPPQTSPTTTSADERERLRAIYQDCRGGDEAACRRLASLCAANPGLCPADVPLPTPSPQPTRPPSTPTSRPQDTRPTRTPTPTAQRPSATPTPVRDARPTATPTPRPADERPTATPTQSRAGDGREPLDAEATPPSATPALDGARDTEPATR